MARGAAKLVNIFPLQRTMKNDRESYTSLNLTCQFELFSRLLNDKIFN